VKGFEWKKDKDGFNDYVNHIKNSQYCLVLAGDTPSSRRLFDAMISGCIPIFIGRKYSMPLEI